MNSYCRQIKGLLLVILIGLTSAGETEAGTPTFLETEEIISLTSFSLLTQVVGRNAGKFSNEKKSFIKGPLPLELGLHKFIGGRYYEGKTNFLDNLTGSLVTPVVGGAVLTIANLTQASAPAGKQNSQDLVLYLTGLGLTKGLTDMTKGIFARPRPFTRFVADSTEYKSKHGLAWNRHAFFSGHASGAFFSMAYLNLRVRSLMRENLSSSDYEKYRWSSPALFFGWASVVAWSRIHAYRHYPSDVIAGALAGWLMAELMFSLNNNADGYQGRPSPGPVMFKVSFPL